MNCESIVCVLIAFAEHKLSSDNSWDIRHEKSHERVKSVMREQFNYF